QDRQKKPGAARTRAPRLVEIALIFAIDLVVVLGARLAARTLLLRALRRLVLENLAHLIVIDGGSAAAAQRRRRTAARILVIFLVLVIDLRRLRRTAAMRLDRLARWRTR